MVEITELGDKGEREGERGGQRGGGSLPGGGGAEPVLEPRGKMTVIFKFFFFFGHTTWHAGISVPQQI